jgi:glutamate N-acetyltransferase/amino-acid N-acetyltransferase
VTSPAGFVAGGVYCGIKTPGPGKLDLGILASETPATAAAIFTRNAVKACAVAVSQAHLRDNDAQAIVVNSGCSNVATGTPGMRDSLEMAQLAGERIGARTTRVLVGSTGVIGRRLPMDNIRDGIARVDLSRDGGNAFARANMTTDTREKEVAVRFRAAGRTYTIGACAKGSGMIHPDMATMFCWITTDIAAEKKFLHNALLDAADVSLNMISVDHDTSTSDTTAILANGAAGGPVLRADSEEGPAFQEALTHVCTEIAKMLARDGEGATRLIEVRVDGANGDRDARRAARTISASPLVKSAVHGNDPNWGRVLMAAGRSGARMNIERASVWLGDIHVFAGEPLPFDEHAASKHLSGEHVFIRIDLGAGGASATAWGCDLTCEYVRINSDYTT